MRNLLGLAPNDVITGISGRPFRRQLDVHDALVGASMMNTTAVYDQTKRIRIALMRLGVPEVIEITQTP